MKFVSKLIATGLAVMLVQFAHADDETVQSSAPNECVKPCAPAPCPKPCAPAPCPKPCPKPCAPAPCPKPCPPKPCPPKPCCPPVCFERGYPNDNCCFPSAYNEPASYDLGPCPWDFWVDASFTYWEAQQEGMCLGINTAVDATSDTLEPAGGKLLFQDNKYKPGFKIGLGMDLGHDDWSAYAEYTWFRSRTTTNATAPADSRGTPVISLTDLLVGETGLLVSANNISSHWRLNMDLVDVGVMRPFYQGTHLIMAPFGGIRGQFIRQHLTISANGITEPTIGALGAALPSATSRMKSNSWAVGPRAGVLGKWHLGWGVRFEGDVAASLLYTRYTKASFNTDPVFISGIGAPNTGANFRNYNCLRAVNEMNLGIGWGHYFDCRNYHLDLLLSYDFQVYWNQNMMRQLLDLTYVRGGFAPSNLYLQGLTVKAQFDF